MANNNQIIPIVFSVDDNYAPFLGVTLESLIQNCNKNYFYKLYVLNTDLSDKNKEILAKYNREFCKVIFIDVNEELNKIGAKLHLRDYYTYTTYYRFFIPELFPEYEKALYLDSDIAVIGDISELYMTEIGDNLVGAIPEDVMAYYKCFGDYVEKGLNIKVEKFFNAGIMVMNLNKMREINIVGKLEELLAEHKFEVTQDEDYLNVICKDKVKYIPLGWNKSPLDNSAFNNDELKLIHYKLALKPWKYDGVQYGDYFWQYAKETEYYDKLMSMKNNYGEQDKQKDNNMFTSLCKLAEDYLLKEDNYKNWLIKKGLA